MADVTQELMLRVRGDNSGADKAIASTKTAVEGLKVSGEKATGAFKSFSRSLAESRDASDVAASAANSLSNIVSKSLMGAFAVGGVKLFTDQINRMGEDVKSVATSAQKAFDDIEKAGQAMSLSEAINQVSQLDALLSSTGKKLSELDRSPFQNFIAGATGARAAMEELVGTSQKLRDMKLAEGMATENANAKFIAGLNEQDTQIAKVNAEYEKRFKIAQTLTDEEAYRIYQDASHAIRIRETNAIIDSMAQKAAEEKQKNTHEQIKLNQDLSQQQIKGEKELAEAQQKRFNELYDAEVKAQEATQKRIDANLKAEQDLADQRKALVEDVAKAESAPIGAGGGGGGGPSYGGGGGGGAVPGLNTRGPGQRETSAQKGAREAGERAFERGRKAETERTQKNIGEQLKAQGKPSDLYDVNREIQKRLEENSDLQGRNSEGLKDSNDAYENAKQKLKDFDSGLKSSNQATTDFGAGLSQSLSALDPSLQSAMDSVTNLADSIMENSGNMVEDFMNTGSSASDLGGDFSDLGKSANDLSDQLKKSSGGGGGGGGKPSGDGAGGSLASIEKLLRDNFNELKAYAHAT